MRKNDHKPQGGIGGGKIGNNNGFIPSSFRSLSSYLRIVSSGASTVASTVRSAASAASAIVDRENDPIHDQVIWAGFDKLEWERNISRRVLLLGFQLGFQVWDVEDSNNVRNIVSRYDGAVSFMQILPKPTTSKHSQDEFANSRPLLVICADSSYSAGGNTQGGSTGKSGHDQLNGGFLPTAVWLYSLKSQSYVKELKFRSVVYSVRCSSRIVAVLQAAQVHCFNAMTLERDYTILTNPVVTNFSGHGNIGLGPLAVGPRWIAYSGSAVPLPNTRVNPQHLVHSPGSNGSVVAHYAKQSSKQLAAGIVTLGDMGYKKLSRYYSEQSSKDRGSAYGHLPDAESIGLVIVRDVISKSVIAQFKAHDSPIASLCFDPSGTILVTASVQGHNFNVFRIMPGLTGASPENGASYVHLYRLQRGFTNAVIQDISFSVDSHWIMISSSRGTSHLFAISPSGGPVNLQFGESCLTTNSRGYNTEAPKKPVVLGSPSLGPRMLNQQVIRASGPPITLSAVSRIRSGNSGWKNMVTGAAIAASGRANSYSGVIASAFHRPGANNLGSSMSKYNILVYSSSGCVIQYGLRLSSELDSRTVMSGMNTGFESSPDCDSRLVVEPIQKWNLCHKSNRREREENVDIYGENGHTVSRRVFPEGPEKPKGDFFEHMGKVKNENTRLEERNHVFISEAELQMHQFRIPLWARTQIYFQPLIVDDVVIDEENDSKGEFEIEKIPTTTIEARSRDLVPVVDYLGGPKFQMTRVPVSAFRSDGGVSLTESEKGKEEIVVDENTIGDVNNDNGPTSHAQPEPVNNRDTPAGETQSELVNSNIGQKVENQTEDQHYEFN